MIYSGKQPIIPREDVNSRLKALPEIMSDDEAKKSLAEFLHNNIGLCWEIITKHSLPPFQEAIIKGWFLKDYNLYVASRGLGKSFIIAIFCLLYSIFYPNTQIVIISANFRAVKRIFSTIEKFLKEPKNGLLSSNFLTNKSGSYLDKAPDQQILTCKNGSKVIGLPLSGEGLRGTRAQVLFIDEGLLISKEIQKVVLEPFLASNLDLDEQKPIIDLESKLIEDGLMKEEDRTQFRKNKLIICSSASFEFEYLYQGIYEPYIKNIRETHSGEMKDPSYFVVRAAYHIGLKHNIIQADVIKAAEQGGGFEDPLTAKEYWAKFVDVSGGFFNIKHAKECMHQVGEEPSLQVFGTKGAEYILAIDPSYSASKSSDFFAMSVFMINHDEKKITLVHSYGRAGGLVSDHYEYLTYILTHFNIVWIIIDSTGTDGQFITSYNETELAKNRNINLSFLDVDFETEGYEYAKSLDKAKTEWNIKNRVYVQRHVFSSATNRKANEHLQGEIQAKRVWFGAKISMNDSLFKRLEKFEMPFKFKDRGGKEYEKTFEFLQDQDIWIDETINQLAMIHLIPSSNGHFKYDLPASCVRNEDPDRPRKDNYSALLLAVYAAKFIFDIHHYEEIIDQNADGCVVAF